MAHVNNIKFSSFEGCAFLGAVFYLVPGDGIEKGLCTPPCWISLDSQVSFGGIPLLNFVGSCPVFIKGFIKAVVEELRVFQRRVQEDAEASIGWVPRGFHGNADGVFVACFFDGGYLFPGSPVVYSVVVAAVVFAAQDFPGGA